MGEIVDKIIKQSSPPSNKNVLWYNGDNLKICNNGKWKPVVKVMSEDTMTKLIETLDGHKMSLVEFTQDGNTNLETLAILNLTTNYICNYKLSDDEIIHGTYYNGTISSFYNNEITLWDVNFTTGIISKKLTLPCELLGTEVLLDVCSSGSEEAASNLEKLTKAYVSLGDHFTVNIDAGIGVGKFIPSTGGEGHITTAEGVNVHYTFGTDGSVIKISEVNLNSILNELNNRVTNLENS